MQQKRPDWFPEGLWVLMLIGLTLLVLWPLKVWVIEPGAALVVPALGNWFWPVFLGLFAIAFAIIIHRNWRRGLLPYQRRRQEALRRRIEH